MGGEGWPRCEEIVGILCEGIGRAVAKHDVPDVDGKFQEQVR
jgi:hypothetical protein